VDAVTAPSEAVLGAHVGRGLFQDAGVREVIQCISQLPNTTFSGGGDQGVVIGYLGRLSEDKGVGRLLGWFAGRDGSTLGNARLLIAGTGPMERKVRAAAAADPRIDYLGYTAPDEFFSRITVLVVPSIWHDPSPVVIREAYSRGVPVVGSNFGGIPELIRMVDDRLICDPFVARDITRAIQLASSRELRPKVKSRCVEVARRFEESVVCDQMEQMYRQCPPSPRPIESESIRDVYPRPA
jgi:glycosyltransferase involved in cell wall biosynthesis